MNAGLKSIGLFAALSLAALAGACGPATPEVKSTDNVVNTAPTGSGTPDAKPAETSTPATDSSATPAATPSGTPATGPATPPVASGPSKSTPLSASKMLEDLKKAGVNVAKIGKLQDLPLATKKKVMPLMQKALGYTDCKGCHVEGDFKAETRNMKVAREMWAHYVTDLRDEKGGALFCDSCHNGSTKVLARADKEALKEFMEKEYEHKLTRADKKDHDCGTCHGDAMEMKIIANLWKIGPEAKK